MAHSRFSPYPHTDAFANAEAFLAKGKSKMTRPIANNTSLRRVSDDDIAVVLHSTAVVTYHRDGTQTIYGGGWNSVTTKARIREFSAANPGSDGQGGWHVGTTGEITQPRVQKCRSCKHRGTWMEDDWCHGPSNWGPGYCAGGSQQYRLPIGADGWYDTRYTEPCKHGSDVSHHTAPCSHGLWSRHHTGRSERRCYRCNGTGMQDYGSKAVPIPGVNAHTPYVVDATGTFLRMADSTPSTWAMPCPIEAAKQAAKAKALNDAYVLENKHSYGGEVTTALKRVIPNLTGAKVKHPVTAEYMDVASAIISLNDGNRWSRERIADWLDTLDVDLSIQAA